MITGTDGGLLPVICLAFEMLAFISTLMVGRKKSTMPRYTFFLHLSKYILSVSSKQCVHEWYPLFVYPERLLRAGQSLMVTNNNACRLNSSCLCSSHHVHRFHSTTVKVLQLMALGTHQCRCRVA